MNATTLLTNTGWDQMNAQCPAGVCGAGSTLNGYDLDGWTWASQAEVGGLFAAVSPHSGGVETYNELNSTWAPAFFSEWNTTVVLAERLLLQGFTSTLVGSGLANISTVQQGLDGVWLDHTSNTAAPFYPSTFPNGTTATGGWFYQTSAVPVPAAVWLFGSGLLGLIGVARRKKAA